MHKRASQTIRRLPLRPGVFPRASAPGVGAVRASSECSGREVAFDWVSDRSRYAGAALHGFLQRIAREGLDAIGTKRRALAPRRGIERC
jgi:hypothetical protein